MQTALLIIDMQMDMAHRSAEGADRANPGAEGRVADLLALFRARGLPVIHVHHDEPGTPFRLDQPGGAPMPCAAPLPDEVVLIKSRSSGFAGTGLEAHLRSAGITRLVVVGAEAGFCVTSTTRAASDLGYEVLLPGDALIGFEAWRADGSRIAAATVLDVTLALLNGSFARVLPSAGVAAAL